MTWWQAIVLGLVEGVTEYLPVSSTGHLILAQRAMGLEGDAANAYAICIQAGAIVAVLGLYRQRAAQVAAGLVGRSTDGLRLAMNLAAAFLPAAVLGVLFDDLIESLLFGLWPIVFAWLVGGVGILAFSSWRDRQENLPTRGLDDLTWQAAMLIGLAQCVAMWPGTSRSLVTIVAGVLVGLSLSAAVEFAFLLGVVTLGAATAYKALDDGELMVATYGWSSIAIGFVTAWLSAVLAVKWMVAWLNRNGLALFGWWRIGLAIVVAGLLGAGTL